MQNRKWAKGCNARRRNAELQQVVYPVPFVMGGRNPERLSNATRRERARAALGSFTPAFQHHGQRDKGKKANPPQTKGATT